MLKLIVIVLILMALLPNGENQTDSSSLSNTTLAGNYTNAFMLENCSFSTTGSNPYFILQPGYHTVFTGVENNEPLNMTITGTQPDQSCWRWDSHKSSTRKSN